MWYFLGPFTMYWIRISEASRAARFKNGGPRPSERKLTSQSTGFIHSLQPRIRRTKSAWKQVTSTRRAYVPGVEESFRRLFRSPADAEDKIFCPSIRGKRFNGVQFPETFTARNRCYQTVSFFCHHRVVQTVMS